MGKPYLETYKYSSMDKLPSESQTKATEQDFAVKPEQLKDFLTKKDLVGLATQKDLLEINTKLEQLQKKIQLNKMIEEGNK